MVESFSPCDAYFSCRVDYLTLNLLSCDLYHVYLLLCRLTLRSMSRINAVSFVSYHFGFEASGRLVASPILRWSSINDQMM